MDLTDGLPTPTLWRTVRRRVTSRDGTGHVMRRTCRVAVTDGQADVDLLSNEIDRGDWMTCDVRYVKTRLLNKIYKIVKEEPVLCRFWQFWTILIFALILTTFGISSICWIDDKKSHLKRVLRAWELQVSDFQVFQGNVATCLRCGDNIILVLLEIYCCLQQWKNFADRSRIDKVIAIVRVAPFLT